MTSEFPQEVPSRPIETSGERRGRLNPDLVPRMLRVTAAMGLSGGVVLALSAVRSKLVAIELGPVGTGSVALLLSFIALAGVIGGLGVASAGIRELAATAADERRRDLLRGALYRTSFVLACSAAVAIVFAAPWIAGTLLDDSSLDGEVRICGLATFMAIVATAPLSDLNALRRIRPLAVIQALAAGAATVLTAIAFIGGWDLIPVVLLAPSAALAVFAYAGARGLARLRGPARTVDSWHLIRVGSGFVLNAGLAAVSALAVRVLIEAELGRAATGEFQAAFVTSTYLVTLLFGAYTTDFLPLLSGMRDDPERLNHATNTQVTLGMLLSAPALIAILIAAPLLIPILYSSSFQEAPDLVRIMALGEVMRLAGWTIAFILIARSIPLFIAMEVIYNGVFIAGAVILIPDAGLEGVGIAYVLAQLVGLGAALALVFRSSRFQLSRENVALVAAAALAFAGAYACAASGGWGVVAAGTIALVSAVLSLWRVMRLRRPGASGFPISRAEEWIGHDDEAD